MRIGNRLGVWKDPLLHLIALGAILVLAIFAIDRFASSSTEKGRHPADCQACAKCPSAEVAARDLFLWKSGSIDPPDSSD